MSENDRWFRNAFLKIILRKADSAAGISIIENKMLEGYGPPLHVHNGEDETFYILEGLIRFRIGDETAEHGAGESLHVPGGQVHTFRVLSPVARFLTVTNGGFEDMVMAASVVAGYPDIPEQVPITAEDQAQLKDICQKTGIEILGPPIH